MKVGLHLPSAQPGASAHGVLQVARTAERLSYDSVWMFDHLFTPSDLGSRYPYSRDGSYALSPQDPFLDPLGIFGVIAGATERIAIGSAVLIPAYRHPIVLAKVVATIENFAPGRILLGIGAGWMQEEFAALGVPYEERGARLEEYVQALRAIWSGEVTAFEGRFYRWPEGGFLPAPTSPIPVIIGGHSDRALRRAARLGDGWAIATGKGQGSGIDAVTKRLDLLRTLLEKENRALEGFELVYQSLLWFSEDPNPKLPLTGPPEAIAEGLKRLGDTGVTTVDLITFGPPDLVVESAERFSEEVRPLL